MAGRGHRQDPDLFPALKGEAFKSVMMVSHVSKVADNQNGAEIQSHHTSHRS